MKLHKLSESIQGLPKDYLETLISVTRRVVGQEARRIVKRDGGHLPGFSIRVKAAALDRLAEEYGERRTEHVPAVDALFREFNQHSQSVNGANRAAWANLEAHRKVQPELNRHNA